VTIGLLVAAVVAVSATNAMAWNDDYKIKTDPTSSDGHSTDIEMRQQNNYDPSDRYRGQIDDDGSVRMRDLNGNTVRGTIDDDGYGRLHDQDGNVYRVRPR
jgi:hypothetical protein